MRTYAATAVAFIGVEAGLGVGALVVQNEGVHAGWNEGAQRRLACRRSRHCHSMATRDELFQACAHIAASHASSQADQNEVTRVS